MDAVSETAAAAPTSLQGLSSYVVVMWVNGQRLKLEEAHTC